jgi:hypothetical protein
MEIEFYGNYAKAEYIQAVAAITKPSRRATIIRYCLIAVAIVIYIVYFATVATKENQSTFDLARVSRHAISIGILLYFILQPYISAYQTASRLWKGTDIQTPIRGFVSSQGITYIFANGRKEIPWDQFAKIRKTGKFIALLTPEGIFSLLPRSFFKSENDWNTVLQWASSKVVVAI